MGGFAVGAVGLLVAGVAVVKGRKAKQESEAVTAVEA